ncbi:FAD dependent oxidoreductase-domain-containing protein [Apiospora phragmitis]|uniref:FAD dependent oxidoreductase-domain-containing protein n=1 Tax=Apiospora phragmitis TaxID=2905665 RepID=A0ABR1WSP2_9PEZI
MSTPDELLQQYQGQIVPRSFNAGFVTLSYIISLIGAAATLELMNRRTSRNGYFNHFLLVSSSITMGGIAIWCMHYIGNRAIELADGQLELQIAYSGGFTALSFFIPIMVLLLAFVAAGTNQVSWYRIGDSGSLAGGAICGSKWASRFTPYVARLCTTRGNASIANFTCIYSTANVVGSVLIAMAASTAALSLFFLFRASWTGSWWKRGICAVLLAGAVSGMHWCASTGTEYRLVRLSSGTSPLSRNTTVIVVICLSVGASLTLAATAIWTAHVMRKTATKAQQIILAAAIFDRAGRILVTPDGLLPSEKVTDTYIERRHDDVFNVANPLFHWMFRVSRNWSGVSSVIDNMADHLADLPRNRRDGRVRLIDEDGQLVDNYDVVFRELFCLAAKGLADKTREQLANVGILWDEILPTGALAPRPASPIAKDRPRSETAREKSMEDAAEKGEGWRSGHEYSRGSLMFLVRRLDKSRDVERLEAAGYRFADVNQISHIISSNMQIKAQNVDSKLMDMAAFAEEKTMMEPGVHMGFFGVQARVGGGFDIVVRRGARNLLPTVQMSEEPLESWQLDLIRQLDGLRVTAICSNLKESKRVSPALSLFASKIAKSVEILRALVKSPIFDEATLTARVVQVPCRAPFGSSSANNCTMISLRVVIPIHINILSPHYDLMPLSFFKVQQLVYKDSPQHIDFARSIHRELAPIVNARNPQAALPSSRRNKPTPSSARHRFFGHTRSSASGHSVDDDGNSIPTKIRTKSSATSTHSVSTLLRTRAESDRRLDDTLSDRSLVPKTDNQQQSTLGGIMVSQEITVNCEVERAAQSYREPAQSGSKGHARGESTKMHTSDSSVMEMQPVAHRDQEVHVGLTLGSATIESHKSSEVVSFVDELFAVCVGNRQGV